MAWKNLHEDLEDMFSNLQVPHYLGVDDDRDPTQRTMRIIYRRSAATARPRPNERTIEESRGHRAAYLSEYRKREDLRERRNKAMREYRQRVRAKKAIEDNAPSVHP